ncbi:MAG TPA: transposase [Bryobacteraceae bacterium]|nr:transposase [Bryobacteraceae bacterium]
MAAQTDNSIQLVIPLKEVVDLTQRGLMNLALSPFTKVAGQVMDYEVGPGGPKNQAQAERANLRWGSQPGYCVVGGQKIPLDRPRVRDTRQWEVPLGSYALLEILHLYVLDGGKALLAGVQRVAAKAAVVQRCQVHKTRNLIDHLPEEHREHVRQKLHSAVRYARVRAGKGSISIFAGLGADCYTQSHGGSECMVIGNCRCWSRNSSSPFSNRSHFGMPLWHDRGVLRVARFNLKAGILPC